MGDSNIDTPATTGSAASSGRSGFDIPEGVKLVWSPQEGSQQDAIECELYELLYHGSRGRGATDFLLMDFAQFTGLGYGEHWRGILFRNTYKQLADIVARSRLWFHQIFPKAKFNESDYVWKWPTGEELLLRYMEKPKDYWNYHGWQLPWIGWDELLNWATAECYEAMQSTSRSPMPGIPMHVRSTTNWYGKGHAWVKAYFRVGEVPPGKVIVDERSGNERCHIFGHWSENKALLAGSPDYKQKLLSAAGSNEAKRKAWVWGRHDIVAGGMFDAVWYKRPPIVKRHKIPERWLVDRAHDWGSSKPYASVWFAQANGEEIQVEPGKFLRYPRGSIIVIGELYGWSGNRDNPNEGCRHGNSEIGRRTMQAEAQLAQTLGFGARCRPGPADTMIYDVRDGTSIADDMARAGCRWTPAAKGPGSRVTGWQRMAEMFEAWAAQDPERPWLVIFDTCTHTIRTLPALPRDEDDPDDVDTESEDHIADAIRYRILAQKQVGGSSQLAGV